MSDMAEARLRDSLRIIEKPVLCLFTYLQREELIATVTPENRINANDAERNLIISAVCCIISERNRTLSIRRNRGDLGQDSDAFCCLCSSPVCCNFSVATLRSPFVIANPSVCRLSVVCYVTLLRPTHRVALFGNLCTV